LDEQGEDVQQHVDYKGHDLVLTIRAQLPELPVFVVTSYERDEDLQAHFGDVEGILKRTDVSQDPNKHVRRMVRAGMRFVEVHERNLATLSALASKVATGSATDADIAELRSLQTMLGLNYVTQEEIDRSSALTKIEAMIDQLSALQVSVQEGRN
ncbi:hypothetical protein ACFLSJ_09380, partial [Verrucomicrobiota bacterium]